MSGVQSVPGTLYIEPKGNLTVDGVATFNGSAIFSGPLTFPGGGSLTIALGKMFTVNNSLTIAGTDGTTMTFPATSASIARIDAAQVFAGVQTFGALVAATFNGNTFTTGTGALTIAAGKTLTANSTLTLAGTDGNTLTINTSMTLTGAAGKTLTLSNSLQFIGLDGASISFPLASISVARSDAAQAFTGVQTFNNGINLSGVYTATRLAKFSAVLSPVAVAANTTAEQIFAVAGVSVGDVLQVNKPTSQAGLGIVGVRVSSAGNVGINFSNNTAAPITPTAAETYLFSAMQ